MSKDAESPDDADYEKSVDEPILPLDRTNVPKTNQIRVERPDVDWSSRGPRRLENGAAGGNINAINSDEVKEWCDEQAKTTTNVNIQRFLKTTYARYCLSADFPVKFHLPTRASANRYGYFDGIPDWLETKARTGGWPSDVYFISLTHEAEKEVRAIIGYFLHLVSEGRTRDFNNYDVKSALVQAEEYDNKSKNDAYDGAHETTNVKQICSTRSFRWVEMLNQVALSRESALLDHCVGRKIVVDYADSMEKGERRIFSLRAAGNKPVYTVDLKKVSNGWHILAALGFRNHEPAPVNRGRIIPLIKALEKSGVNVVDNEYWSKSFFGKTDMADYLLAIGKK